MLSDASRRNRKLSQEREKEEQQRREAIKVVLLLKTGNRMNAPATVML